MALTVFTAQDQAVGPVSIPRDRPISIRAGGDLSRGSVMVWECSRTEEDAWLPVMLLDSTTMQSLSATSFYYQTRRMEVRGFKHRVRCSTFAAGDAPSAEIF